MKKGSITLFCALSLMLVASLVFALLESARFRGLDYCATLKAEAAIDSVCAEYQPYLWREYGLLFLDGAYGTEEFSVGYVLEQLDHYMETDASTNDWLNNWMGVDLFRLEKAEVLLEGYALAADDEGELFLNYVAGRAKEKLSLGIAEELLAKYQKVSALEEECEDVTEAITKAQKAIAEAKSEWVARREEELIKQEDDEKQDASENDEVVQQPDTSVIDNLFSMAQQLRSESTLHMIFSDESGISSVTFSMSEPMHMRKKQEGTMYLKSEKDWYRKLLVLAYLESYFSNYTSSKEGHLLQYEMEYALCGKGTEEENLACALERILLLREAANIAHILSDGKKMAQIEELASILGLLAGGNYGIVKAVEFGIAGVWAYAESVMDVRALVHGEKIPLVKQEAEWTIALDELHCIWDKGIKAKKCESGLDYTDYLKQLLFWVDNQALAYRMMEVMEFGMRCREEYKNCRMDHMIVMLRYKVKFRGVPVFSEMLLIGSAYRVNYIFSKEIERSYVP